MKSTVYLPPLHRSQPPYMDYPAPPPPLLQGILEIPSITFQKSQLYK